MNSATRIPHSPFHLRPLQLSDIPTYLAIDKATFPTPTKEKAIHYELNQNKLAHYQALTFVSGVGTEQLIGYAGTWLLGDEVHIITIAVDPKWQRRGLGELLLLDLLANALSQNALLVTLEVRENNLAAQVLYKKYQFEIVGERKRYYRDTGENALLMTVMLQGNSAYSAFLTQQISCHFSRWSKAE